MGLQGSPGRGGGAFQYRELAELCGKKIKATSTEQSGRHSTATLSSLTPWSPDRGWSLLSPGKPVTKQEPALDLRVHGHKVPFPLPTQ